MQGFYFPVVDSLGMEHNREKQGQGRIDGAIRSSVDRRAVGRNPAFASEIPEAPARRTAPSRRPQGIRRDFVDSAKRRSEAGLARGISLAGHLVAAARRLGAARGLAHNLARVCEGMEPAPAVELEWIIPGRQLCSGEKRGCGVGKTKRGKGTKWMVVVDGQSVPLGDQLHSASPAEVRISN
jgi:hypothetical protein